MIGDPWITLDSGMVRGKRFAIAVGLTREQSTDLTLSEIELVDRACPPHQEKPSKATKDISCIFRQSPGACYWNALNGAELKLGSYQPKDNVNQAWVSSKETSGLGPYCFNVKYDEVVQVGSTNLTIELNIDNSKRNVIFKRFQPLDATVGEVASKFVNYVYTISMALIDI